MVWEGGSLCWGADASFSVRPVADPACQSLQPWVMVGSRPAHGGRGVDPVAIEFSPRGFIGVIVVLFVVGFYA